MSQDLFFSEVDDAEESSEGSIHEDDNNNEVSDDDSSEDSDEEGHQVVEVSRMVFETLKKTTRPQDATIVSFSLKSLKKLELLLNIWNYDREITLTFP